MSKKTKTSTKPAAEYAPYISGAADAVSGAYDANAGQIQGATDSIVGLLPSMIDKYKAGDAGVNAARNYNVDVLSGNYLNGNPHLQGVIDSTNNDIVNQSQASLGLRGLTGGSSYADIISRNVGRNTSDLRYTDYNNERGRMANAAGQAPGLASADVIQIAPLMAALEASQTPVRAAAGQAASLGGLLGSYQDTTQRQAPFGYLMQALGNAASAYAGGA